MASRFLPDTVESKFVPTEKEISFGFEPKTFEEKFERFKK